MTHSLNEISALARKAARGAGMPWGLAEESAEATRWLCAHRLPGVECLASVLHDQDRAAWEALCPVMARGVWSSRGTALCPIAAGASLSDRAAGLAGLAPLTLRSCRAPLMLLPFACETARLSGHSIGLTTQQFAAVCTGNALVLDGTFSPDRPPADVTLTCPAASRTGPPVPLTDRAAPDPAALDVLTGFAARLYAPETEARRRDGAGASGPGALS
ncbi:MAG: DUF3726 domain-containing protein [Pseudomonadota bacterium]